MDFIDVGSVIMCVIGLTRLFKGTFELDYFVIVKIQIELFTPIMTRVRILQFLGPSTTLNKKLKFFKFFFLKILPVMVFSQFRDGLNLESWERNRWTTFVNRPSTTHCELDFYGIRKIAQT